MSNLIENTHFLKSKFSRSFLDSICKSNFEFGYDSLADIFIREHLAENSLTKTWINEIFIENFRDIGITTGILRVIAHLDYREIAPQGLTIALAALSHSSAEVRECGIRAFENWSTSEGLEILRTVKCKEKWLQDYVDQVIIDIEKEDR